MDEVCHYVQFDVKGLININNISAQVLDKIVGTIDFHRDNDLFSQWSLGGYIYSQFWFFISADDFLYYFNFFVLKTWEGLLNF